MINYIASSLQCFEDNVGHPNRVPQFFVVQNVAVLENASHKSTAVPGKYARFESRVPVHPYKGLKYLMPESHKNKMSLYAYESHPDWGPCDMFVLGEPILAYMVLLVNGS
jgi:hypothetical protein